MEFSVQAKVRVKESFEERLVRMLGREEYGEFLSAVAKRGKKCIRINTLKVDRGKMVKRLEKRGWRLEKVPWFESAYWVDVDTKTLSLSIEHALGYFYIQDAASMLPPIALQPKKEEVILDLCAAPGSKTTQVAQMMENTGAIVANDYSLRRLAALRGNVQRLGIVNCVVTYMDALEFWKCGLKFKKILLDVPCSGSGSVINCWRIFEEWSLGIVRRLSRYQKDLLRAAVKCLDKEGVLVYSTCSLEPEENEEVVDFAIRELGLEVEETKFRGLKFREGLTSWEGKRFHDDVSKAVRIFPHDNLTEGFFVCKLVKK